MIQELVFYSHQNHLDTLRFRNLVKNLRLQVQAMTDVGKRGQQTYFERIKVQTSFI